MTDTSNTVVSVSRKVVDTVSIKTKGIIDNILYSSLHWTNLEYISNEEETPKLFRFEANFCPRRDLPGWIATAPMYDVHIYIQMQEE